MIYLWSVYETRNKINNKIYIGVNKVLETDILNEKYLGSGNSIKRAIKKYGRKNFSKKILFIFTDKEEAYSKERELVDELFILREDTYNLCVGGKGARGRKMSKEQKDSISKFHKGKEISLEQRKLLSERMNELYSKTDLRNKVSIGVKRSFKEDPSIIERIRSSMKERAKDPEYIKKVSDGVKKAANWKDRPDYLKKMSEAKKNTKKYECPHCNKNYDGGNFSKHMKMKHNWSNEDILSYKDVNVY
jgi:hypothetical protein